MRLIGRWIKERLWGPAKIALALAASVGLGWLAIRGLDWGLVSDSIRGISPSLVFLAVVVFLAASYLRAFRWQILFVNERISTNRLFVIQNEGIGLNNVMPLRVASEPVQLAILSIRDRVKPQTALVTLVLERVIDVIASTLILALAFFLVPEMKNFTLYVWGAVGFAIAVVVLLRLLSWGGEAWSFVKRIAFVAAFAAALRELERERARLLMSLLISIVYWVMVGVTAWIVAVAIDLPISPMTATLVIMGTIFFATSVPAAPSAIGTFEFAIVYVLEFFGIDREASFGFAIVVHAVFFLPPTIIAAVFLPREGMLSLDRLRRLTDRGASAMQGHGPNS